MMTMLLFLEQQCHAERNRERNRMSVGKEMRSTFVVIRVQQFVPFAAHGWLGFFDFTLIKPRIHFKGKSMLRSM